MEQKTSTQIMLVWISHPWSLGQSTHMLSMIQGLIKARFHFKPSSCRTYKWLATSHANYWTSEQSCYVDTNNYSKTTCASIPRFEGSPDRNPNWTEPPLLGTTESKSALKVECKFELSQAQISIHGTSLNIMQEISQWVLYIAKRLFCSY